jgi:hypothetical protein
MSRRTKQAVEKSQDPVGKNVTYAAAALAALAILCSLWALTREWDKPLLDLHSFRQTQTAISTYYMVGKPGILLDYETPILGKPWAIPLEVPFYQWVVARWHEASSMGLDQSGKFVSIIFLFACIAPIWILFRTLRIPLAPRWLTIAVFLSMPLHLYWGRAFLIETMGLFLSLSMVSCTFAGYRSKGWRWLAAGLAFGILAALCKITTWAVACGISGLLVLFSDGLPRRKDLSWLILTGAVAILPIVPGKLWLAYGDDMKAANPFALEIITASSDKQSVWTFGSWEQKTSPAVWERIGSHMGDQLAAPLPFFGHWLVPLILIAGALANPKRLPLLLIFLVGFAAGPLVFTNLYFEHNYYWAANGTWLILALGVALAAISEFRPKEVWPQYTATAVSAVICISGFAAWHSKFLPILQNLPDREKLTEAWIGPIQKLVPPERSILILGNDWNPNAFYYAERKGIGYPSVAGVPFPSPLFEESLTKFTKEDRLGAVVISEQILAGPDKPLLMAQLERLGMSLKGTRTGFGVAFPALDLDMLANGVSNP